MSAARLIGDIWYFFVQSLAFAALLIFWSLRMAGQRHIPRRGPVLLVANHQSYLDPPMVSVSFSTRQTHFLARGTLFDSRWLGPLISSLKAVPINLQSLGKDGIRAILEVLAAGQIVLVFPEGTRTPDGQMKPLEPGITLLLKRVKCPVVPVGIAGSFQSWGRKQKLPLPAPLFLAPSQAAVAVVFGQPLDPEELLKLPRDEQLQRLWHAIHQCQQSAEQLRRCT